MNWNKLQRQYSFQAGTGTGYFRNLAKKLYKKRKTRESIPVLDINSYKLRSKKDCKQSARSW